jgi:WD40 repeat protein
VGRYYIATGTAKYEDSALDLPTVVTDLKDITEALEAVGFTKADVNPPLNPTTEDLRAFEQWFEQREPGDDVVLYYVGHGKSDDQHYLVLQRDEFASLDLVRTFARNPVARRILLVLDTCESGSASLDLAEKWRSFEDRFTKAGAHLTLVTSSRSNGVAQTGAFTPAFAKALRNEGRVPNRNQPRTPLSDLLELELPQWQRKSVSSFPFSDADGSLCFDFPNPDFDANVPEGLDLESQRRLVEQHTHWDDRVRYFTGRAQALSDIEAFLAAPQGGVLVVTGGPGSGKSSVLAHFVLSSKSIDLSIHAKGRDLLQMMQIVSGALEIPLVDLAAAGDEQIRAKALAKAVGEYGKLVTLAIDALDEALQPAQITRSLLATLATCSNVRMLIGTRPDTRGKTGQRFQGLGSATVEIDLDSDRYFAPEDMEIYARTRLLAAGPYAADEPLAHEAARAVARKAARTFLIAKLECDSLVNLPQALDPGKIWQSPLPSDIKTAFRDYLDRFPDETARREVFQVLQPLAFGFGQGLPSRIWERLAQALSGESVPAVRIREVLDKAGAYVVETVEDGSSVYRLFHQKFAEFFLDQCDVADCHSRITSALLPEKWPQAPYYTRRYLALHAEKAGRLDELLENPAYLVVADPSTLKRVVGIGKSDAAVRNAGVYSVVSHLLGENLAERAASLALGAIKFGYRELSGRLQELGSSCAWWPRAAQWQVSPHFVIRNAHDAVRSVAVGEKNGRLVIASGGDDGLIRFWDRETLEPVGSPLVAFRDLTLVDQLLVTSVRSLAITAGGQPRLLASNAKDVWEWDLETLEPVSIPVPNLNASAWSKVGSRCFAISISLAGKVEVRDVETWELVREPFALAGVSFNALCALSERDGRLLLLTANLSELCALDLLTLNPVGSVPEKGCNALAIGKYAGLSVIVTGTTHGDVNLWSSDSFKLLAGPLRGHQTYVDGVAVDDRNGASFVVSGSRDSSIRIWTPTLSSKGQWSGLAGISNVSALSTCQRNGKPIVITGGWTEPVRVWEGETLELLGIGKSENAAALAITERLGRPIILAGGKEGVLRALALETLELLNQTDAVSEIPSYNTDIAAIIVGNRKGRAVAISATRGGTILVRDLEKWEPAGKPIVAPAKGFFSLGMAVTSLALGEDQDRLLLLSAGNDGTISFWDLETLEESGPPLTGHESVIYDLAVGQYQGSTVVASVSFDQTIRLWDLGSRKALGSPLRGHEFAVQAVAIGKWNARPVVVSGGLDGTIRIWDLETHAQITVINVDSRVFSLKLCGNRIVVGCARGLAIVELR